MAGMADTAVGMVGTVATSLLTRQSCPTALVTAAATSPTRACTFSGSITVWGFEAVGRCRIDVGSGTPAAAQIMDQLVVPNAYLSQRVGLGRPQIGLRTS